MSAPRSGRSRHLRAGIRMTEDLLLGLDLGTEFTKAAAVTLDGVERSHGRARTPWRVVPTGAEMDSRALVDAAVAGGRGGGRGVRGRPVHGADRAPGEPVVHAQQVPVDARSPPRGQARREVA